MTGAEVVPDDKGAAVTGADVPTVTGAEVVPDDKGAAVTGADVPATGAEVPPTTGATVTGALVCAETTATKIAAMATVNFILLTDLRLKDEDNRTNWLATNCMNYRDDKFQTCHILTFKVIRLIPH